jgi:hypothetical protein
MSYRYVPPFVLALVCSNVLQFNFLQLYLIPFPTSEIERQINFDVITENAEFHLFCYVPTFLLRFRILCVIFQGPSYLPLFPAFYVCAIPCILVKKKLFRGTRRFWVECTVKIKIQRSSEALVPV